jgi:hypothetical protein
MYGESGAKTVAAPWLSESFTLFGPNARPGEIEDQFDGKFVRHFASCPSIGQDPRAFAWILE